MNDLEVMGHGGSDLSWFSESVPPSKNYTSDGGCKKLV